MIQWLIKIMQARATHICLDCGYIYFLPKSFDEQVIKSIIYIKISLKNISMLDLYIAHIDTSKLKVCLVSDTCDSVVFSVCFCDLNVMCVLLQPDTYSCPQCQAPKKRFAEYDVNTGRAIGGGGLPPIGVIIGLVAGLGAVGALLVFGLQ
jgi:rubredoxin